jgi:hypothetical protein
VWPNLVLVALLGFSAFVVSGLIVGLSDALGLFSLVSTKDHLATYLQAGVPYRPAGRTPVRAIFGMRFGDTADRDSSCPQ